MNYFLRLLMILSLASLILSSCAAPAVTDDGLTILTIDEEHRQLPDAPTMTEPYVIQPGKGFALNLADYTFQVPSDVEFHKVNMIQISLGNENMVYYQPVTTDQGLYKITAENMTIIGEGQPFPSELKDGDNITVGIGYWDKGRGMFVMWYGYVKVAEGQ